MSNKVKVMLETTIWTGLGLDSLCDLLEYDEQGKDRLAQLVATTADAMLEALKAQGREVRKWMGADIWRSFDYSMLNREHKEGWLIFIPDEE